MRFLIWWRLWQVYNFFSSSPVNSTQAWTALLNFCPEAKPSGHELSSQQGRRGPPGSSAGRTTIPEFSQSRHSRMCRELKSLYTAITRAKKRLWFFDDNLKLREPMLRLWLHNSAVQVGFLARPRPLRRRFAEAASVGAQADSTAASRDQLASKSTAKEWDQQARAGLLSCREPFAPVVCGDDAVLPPLQGREFFRKGKFTNAASCFRVSLKKDPEDARVRRRLQASEAFAARGAGACRKPLERLCSLPPPGV